MLFKVEKASAHRSTEHILSVHFDDGLKPNFEEAEHPVRNVCIYEEEGTDQ